MNTEYKIDKQAQTQLVEVDNLLNENDNRQILSIIKDNIKSGTNRVVVNLSKSDFLNSVGLNFLISLLTTTQKEGGALVVTNVSDQVLKLMRVTKLAGLFSVAPTVEAAMKGLR